MRRVRYRSECVNIGTVGSFVRAHTMRVAATANYLQRTSRERGIEFQPIRAGGSRGTGAARDSAPAVLAGGREASPENRSLDEPQPELPGSADGGVGLAGPVRAKNPDPVKTSELSPPLPAANYRPDCAPDRQIQAN